MKSPVEDMLERYPSKTPMDRVHALKEIVQEIALCALARAGFFREAAFYGGTALRIFHGLDRFSEDLDFSLIHPNLDFRLSDYLPSVKDELMAYGFEMEVEKKEKQAEQAVQSAFIKGGTIVHLMRIAAMMPPISGIPATAQLKIKLEIDTDPPAGAESEMKYLLLPISSSVRVYDLPSLFAGKLHALLCRKWKNRVKGRDYYDYLWYLAHGVGPNLPHLEQRMRQSGHWAGKESLNAESLMTLLLKRFSEVDFRQAAQEVRPFIGSPSSLDLWSETFFSGVTRDRLRMLL